VKVVALLSGILASAIAWAASYFVVDLSVEFLTLWPDTISQQFLGLVVWYGIVALPLVGGALAVLSPISGGILLLAAAGVLTWLGTTFPTGFSPQLVVPLAFAAVGALAAFGASIRGLLRRRAEKRRAAYSEAMEREDALRFEPGEDLIRAVEVRSSAAERAASPPDAAADTIVPLVADRRRDGPPHGISGLVVVNALLLAILTLAVGILLYSDFRNGNLSNAFSTLPFDPVVQSNSGSAGTADDSGIESDAGDQMAKLTASAEPPTLADIDQTAQPEVRISSIPLDPATLPVDRWSDPFAYCAALGTVDFPDHRYAGPMVTEAIASALRVPASSPPDRVKWRCVDGAVLGCASFRGPSCAPTPSVTEMLEYCAQNPNAVDLVAPNGTWFCNETEPQIPPGQSWPVDARGFLPGAWVEIAPPAASAVAAAG
jgi:hypothetical protein